MFLLMFKLLILILKNCIAYLGLVNYSIKILLEAEP